MIFTRSLEVGLFRANLLNGLFIEFGLCTKKRGDILARVTKNNEAMPSGKLYICSTPIGHLADSSERLLTTLRCADIVACEDTRHTRKLLTHFDIHPKKLLSYHEHNEESRQHVLLEALQLGQSVALVSDAGTPLLSDPGWVVVDAAADIGVPVIPIPGPSALLAALVGSGLPLTPFLYLGFPPRQKRGFLSWMAPFQFIPATLVLYESPHRLLATLKNLSEQLGDKPAVLAKELTKRHETFIRGTLGDLERHVEEEGSRGEYVIVIDNRHVSSVATPHLDENENFSDGENLGRSTDVTASEANAWQQAVDYVVQKLNEGEHHKMAVQEASTRYGIHRRTLYNETLRDKGQQDDAT